MGSRLELRVPEETPNRLIDSNSNISHIQILSIDDPQINHGLTIEFPNHPPWSTSHSGPPVVVNGMAGPCSKPSGRRDPAPGRFQGRPVDQPGEGSSCTKLD